MLNKNPPVYGRKDILFFYNIYIFFMECRLYDFLKILSKSPTDGQSSRTKIPLLTERQEGEYAKQAGAGVI